MWICRLVAVIQSTVIFAGLVAGECVSSRLYRSHVTVLTLVSLSPIKSVARMRPGKVIVKMGIFPRISKPECETFANHRHEWQGKHDGLDRYKIQIFGDKMEA